MSESEPVAERPEDERCPACDENSVCGHEWHDVVSGARLRQVEARLRQVEAERDTLMEALGNERTAIYEWMARCKALETSRDNYKRMYDEVHGGIRSGFLDRAEAAERRVQELEREGSGEGSCASNDGGPMRPSARWRG